MPTREKVSWEGERCGQGGDLGTTLAATRTRSRGDSGSGQLAEWRAMAGGQEVRMLRSICVDVGVTGNQARLGDRHRVPQSVGGGWEVVDASAGRGRYSCGWCVFRGAGG